MWPQLIDAQLANPMMRPGKTPPFVPKNVVENDHRLKRVRQWNDRGVETRILPWLGLNPSGFDKTGQGLSGRTMARLAHMWGFDGVATYNLLPFEGCNRRRTSGQSCKKASIMRSWRPHMSTSPKTY